MTTVPPKGRGDAATKDELQRGERFLAAYTVIEQAMRRRWGDPGGKESFRRLVDLLYERDWTVRKFRDDLAEFAELRNAIVHERVNPSYLIAVPLPAIVDRIERIAASMDSPPLVYPRFKRDVACFSPEDRMESVFRKISETGYSQFPVYRGPVYQGLLTDGGITRWVAAMLSRKAGAAGDRAPSKPAASAAPGVAWLTDVPVSEVLLSEKTPDRAKFISQSATLYEAEDLFRNPGRNKWRVAAVLITQNGSPEEPLLGIIAPSDVVERGSQ